MRPQSFLRPFSFLYGLLARVDKYRKQRTVQSFSLPVISVGAITAGGSGKTPVTRALVARLEQEYHVIVLTRGYGREKSAPVIWNVGEPLPSPALIGDEPALIARSMKRGAIAVGPDRAANLQSVIDLLPASAKPVAILDDGFQHYRLRRDVDIVVVDDRTVSERHLLPAGYLREKGAGLGRAHVLLTTSPAAAEFAKRFKGEGAEVFSIEFTSGDVRNWKTGEKVQGGTNGLTAVLVTGIARPERVKNSAESAGIRVLSHLQFRDHHRYNQQDVQQVLNKFERTDADMVLTTEKDAVKLEAFSSLEKSLHVLTLQVDIPNLNNVLKLIHDQF